MGFLGSLFQSKKSSDDNGLESLRNKAERNPHDAKLLQDLALQLKAAGDVENAVGYARKAAAAHRADGFTQKALAVLRMAHGWASPTADLLQDLADLYLQLNHKEDARGALTKLRQVRASAGELGELGRIDEQLAKLGPGR